MKLRPVSLGSRSDQRPPGARCRRPARRQVLGVLPFLACAALLSGMANPAKAVDFNRDIRSILSNKCFTCHGPDEKERQAGLRLDTAAGALAAPDSGEPVVVPGKPGQVEVVSVPPVGQTSVAGKSRRSSWSIRSAVHVPTQDDLRIGSVAAAAACIATGGLNAPRWSATWRTSYPTASARRARSTHASADSVRAELRQNRMRSAIERSSC